MSARGIATCLALASLLTQPAAAQQSGAATAPNVVLIVTDDLGYGDLGSYGAPDVRTPNIDRLAREGVRLTDFYANGSTCTPTRAALISGRYQQRFELERPLGTGVDTGLPAEGRSLPQLLRNNGYATGLVGKWHLGEKSEFGPNAHGFDDFFGFKSGYVDYYQHTAGDGMHDLYENEAPAHVTGYMTDLITDRSLSFIERHARGRFFLEVAYNAPHWPYQRPDSPSTARDNAMHLQPYDADSGTRQDYVAMLERADQGIGAILALLDKTGLTQNTLVIFTNDNGGEWLSRNAPLFHRKWTLWEGGIRVPTILRWPGRIPAGQVSRQVGITFDITASILAATNTPVPTGGASRRDQPAANPQRTVASGRAYVVLADALRQPTAACGPKRGLEAAHRRRVRDGIRCAERHRRTERRCAGTAGRRAPAAAPDR